MRVRGEIIKNVYTLSFIQKNLLKSLGEVYLETMKEKLRMAVQGNLAADFKGMAKAQEEV